MTKKTFYFIILLIGIRNLTNAQELPLYITADQKRNNNFLLEITNYSYTSRGDDEICYTNLTMYSNPNRGFEYSSQSNEDSFSIKRFLIRNNIHNIYFKSISQDYRRCWPEWCCDGAIAAIEKTIPISKYCSTLSFKDYGENHHGDKEAESNIFFNYKVIPLHTLKTSDNNSAKFLPIDVKVPLIAKEGFDNNLYHYEYATEKKKKKRNFWSLLLVDDYDYNWQPLPAKFQQKQSIEVSAEDVLGSKARAEEMIGKPIYFRVVSYDKDTGLVCSSSEVLPLTVTQAAPFITIKNIQSPLCNSNETTATVTIQLSRKLLGSLEQYRKNKGAYLGEVFEKLSFSEKDVQILGKSSIGVNGLPEDLTEYFLQHDRIDNVVLTTATVTTNYQIDIMGYFYYLNKNGERKDIQLYTDDAQHKGIFTITVPQPLTAKAFPIDNRCFGDTQGKIEVRVLGGTPPYKYIKNGEPPVAIAGNFFSIENLASGVYTFTITDKNNCPMTSDNPLVVTVWGPKMPITIMNENTDLVTNVTGFGRADGKIEPIVMGGTLYNYNKNQYIATLYSSKGEISYSKRDLLSADNDIPKYRYVYENLEAGTYTFTVRDYYNCAIMKEITITEPPLLTASITATTTIGCNQNNNDPNNHYELYSNGVLSATVEGGVPPYKYFWKKLGRRVPLQGNDKPIIRGLSKGTYQLVVTDKNDNEATAFYTLTEPPRLMLSVTKSEMTCSAPNGGQATAIASGGTPPYTYLWNTGYSGAYITGLSAGKYFVTVSDSRGCSVQEKVVLSYPEEVEVNNAIITPVTCYEGNDGKIALTLSGGKGNINVSWYDAQGNLLSQRITNGGKTINGLKAGKYKAVFCDQSDCPALEQFYEVLQPEKTVINIPSQITICQGDSRSFDLSSAFPSATFRWTNSTGSLLSTEPTFAVSAKGIYKVEITDQKGCREATTFEVLQSDKVLEVDFLAATNAYYNYTVKLINLSHSITTQWVLPQEVTLIKEENGGAEVRFPKEGTYTIGLKGLLDGCEKTIYKTLWVEKDRLGIGKENSSKEVVIDDFKIVDNPNNGTFRIEVKLKKPAAIKIYGMDILGQMVIPPIEQPESTTFNIPVSNSRLSGQYLIILEAGGDVMVQKMIVH